MRPAQFNDLGFSPGFLQVIEFPEASMNILVLSTRKKLNFFREGVKKKSVFFLGLCPKHRTPPTYRARLGLH